MEFKYYSTQQLRGKKYETHHHVQAISATDFHLHSAEKIYPITLNRRTLISTAAILW